MDASASETPQLPVPLTGEVTDTEVDEPSASRASSSEGKLTAVVHDGETTHPWTGGMPGVRGSVTAPTEDTSNPKRQRESTSEIQSVTSPGEPDGAAREYHAVSNPEMEWTQLLPLLQASLNNAINATTGFSPNQLLMGFNARTDPLSALAEIPDERQAIRDAARREAQEAIAFAAAGWKNRFDSSLSTSRPTPAQTITPLLHLSALNIHLSPVPAARDRHGVQALVRGFPTG
ncbi:uncharacterized protein BKCO1_1100051 [Diplodia corticola]|uniref:Uncharacterized protein n=1 Tax=Diplodia corticola TaxID=236234 RepID=A0A1J9SA35_9PEZI|nr:uncharacterized protein BKCO1_1100051 [Diplodia corticola]OJD36437.1 hypothetical protein BKCO1_1100051 [Diplodia corticola]